MLPYLAPRLGLDLGTGKTGLVSGNRIEYCEPTLLVADARTRRVSYYGKAAVDRVGRLGAGAEMIRPVVRGTIADYAATRFLLRKIFSKAMKPPRVLKPMVVASVPIKLSSVEERALCDAAREAGAGQIYLVPCNLASYVSISNIVNDPRGSLMVDIGAGTSDVSVIASNEIIVGRTIEFGGDDLTAVVQRAMEMTFGVGISREEAVQAKVRVGLQPKGNERILIRKTDSTGETGFRNVEIPQEKLAELLATRHDVLLNGIQETLEETPPELYEDIFFRGMFITGGGSLLKGLPQMLETKFDLKVHMTEQPDLSVIRGIGKILAEFKKFREFFRHHVTF